MTRVSEIIKRNAMAGSLFVSFISLAHGQELVVDWEAAAARAALTERGLYESGGVRDTTVIPEGYTAPVIDPKAHIRESDRQVAKKAAERLAEQRDAERAAVSPLVQQLQNSRVAHGQQLRSLSNQAVVLQSQLNAAKEDKKRAEATQKSYNESQTWYGAAAEVVTGVVTDTNRTNTQASIDDAQKRIDSLTSQLQNTQSAIRFKTQEVQTYERRLKIEITKAQSTASEIEKQKRVDAATELATAYHTQEQQIITGQRAFDEQIETLDAAIAQAEKNNLTDVATQFRKDRAKTYDTHQQWLAGQNSELETRRKDLQREFSQNRADGIGPTNESLLRFNLRTRARANGQDPETAVDFVDESLVENTSESAARIASGAPGNTEHVSIFNEVNSESLTDFALDYAAEARVTYGSWDGFKSRVIEGYGLGLVKGGVDIVKDLFNLIVEIGDTAGESLEDAIERMTGAELDVFGDENMQKIREFMRSADALIRDEDGAGLEEAKRLMATAEAIKRVIDRKAEQMAGRGEKGIQQALNISGQVAINLVGIETVAVQGLQKGAALLRGANKLDDLSDAARLADAAEDAAGVGRADGPSTGRPRTGADAASDGPPPVAISDVELSVTKGVSARGNPTDQIAGGKVNINGETAYLTPETELGAGSFTTVYTAKRADGSVITGPNGKPLVVRVTKAADDGLDQVGLLGLKTVDSDAIGVPDHFGGVKLGDGAGEFSGGTITVVERAPDDFNKMRTGDKMPDGTPVRAPDGKMTAGQAIAFDSAMRALNEKGLVWLDNKGDNFSFEHLGGDNWRLVVVDPGGIVPVTGLDPELARKMQRFIDDPQALRDAGVVLGPNVEIQASAVAELLNNAFPDGIDLSLINRLTGRKPGQEYTTLVRELDGALPFNPENGLKYPKTGQLSRAETPEQLEAARAALRAEQRARTGSGTGGGSQSGAKGDAPAGGGRAPDDAKTTPEADAPPGRETGTNAGKRPQTGSCPPTTSRGLVSRIRRAAAKLKSNIVGRHSEVFSDVAVKRDEVIMVRPVNQFSTRLITDNFPTKGMGIKGKSADWGPHRGTIPVDPNFSKMGNPNRTGGPPSQDDLFKYYNYNRRALGQPYYKPSKGPDGETVWQLQEADEAIAKVVTVDGPDGPIEVLGDIATGKPITADYDLFAVGSKKGPGEVGAFDNNMGVISENEVHSMNAINNGVKDAGFEGGNVVHHGPANRFADVLEPADFPMTAFTPDGNMHRIDNVDDLSDFYNTWNALGYKLEGRPGWNLDPNLKPTGKFGPLADNPSFAQRAAAAGIVTGSHAGDEEDCGGEAEILGEDYFEDLFGSEEDDRFGQRPTTGGGGGGAATGLAMGFDGMPVVPPIFFEFGGGPLTDPFTGCSGGCTSATDFFNNGFQVQLEQVFPKFGNNPFDNTDPLDESLEDGFDSDQFFVPGGSTIMPSSPGSSSSGSPSPPSNPLAPFAGDYGGDFGCGVSFTTLGTTGTTQVTLTLPGNSGPSIFNINGSGTQANSQSTDLIIFGSNDHTCRMTSFSGDNQFDLICSNTGGGLCSESFNK